MIRNPPLVISLTAGLLASTLPAQGRPHTMPRAAAGVYAGGVAALIPGVPPSAALQQWFAGSEVPRFPITSGSLRQVRGLPAAAANIMLEIKYVNSALTFAQFSPTIANNLAGTSVTVLPMTALQFPLMPPTQDPNTPLGFIPYATPFMFTGPNLVTQVRFASIATTGNEPILIDAWSQPSATQHLSLGRSCGGTLYSSHDGSNLSLFAQGVPPSKTMWFALGVDNLRLGATTLPIDLTYMGMAGCELGLAPSVVVPVAATLFGTATLMLKAAIPAESAAVYAQALHASTTSILGLATTNMTAIVLGNTGLCNQLFSIDGITAISGPFPYNSTAILMQR